MQKLDFVQLPTHLQHTAGSYRSGQGSPRQCFKKLSCLPSKVLAPRVTHFGASLELIYLHEFQSNYNRFRTKTSLGLLGVYQRLEYL